MIPSFVPKCPNHYEPLGGCGFPLPEKGKGICPVSGVPFEFSAEVGKDKMVKGSNGQMEKAVGWSVLGHD